MAVCNSIRLKKRLAR